MSTEGTELSDLDMLSGNLVDSDIILVLRGGVGYQGTGAKLKAMIADDVFTLTEKRITSRVETLADAATVTPASDTKDGGNVAELSQDTTIANPTGTPTDHQRYTLRVKTTTARALTFGSQFRGSTSVALPSATTGTGKTDMLVFQWNAADSKWDLLLKNLGF